MTKSLLSPSLSNLPSTIKLTLQEMPQNKVDAFTADYKTIEKTIPLAYVFFILLAAHYAYLGKWGMFVLYIITGGGCLIWTIVDLFRMPGLVRDYNAEKAHNIIITLK